MLESKLSFEAAVLGIEPATADWLLAHRSGPWQGNSAASWLGPLAALSLESVVSSLSMFEFSGASTPESSEWSELEPSSSSPSVMVKTKMRLVLSLGGPSAIV